MTFEIVLSRDPAGQTLHHPLRALFALYKLQPLFLPKRQSYRSSDRPWVCGSNLSLESTLMWPVVGMETLTSAGSRLPQKIPVASLAPPTGDNSTNPAHNGGVRQHPTRRRRLPAALLQPLQNSVL